MKFFVPFRPLLVGWLVSFAGWGAVSLLLGINFIAGTDIPWTRALHAGIRDQLPWAILTPLLFRFANRHLIDRSSFRRAIPLHLAAAALVIFGIHEWKILVDPGMGPRKPPPPPPIRSEWNNQPPSRPPFAMRPAPAWDLLQFVSVEIPIYVMIITAAHTLYFYRRAERREGQLARARLQALQTKLRPHFLFNSLNTISGLVYKQPEKAEAVVQMLSELLRFSLRADSETEISLQREIDFIEKYLAIMHVRFEDRVRYELQIAADVTQACVPTLILQPLVENAIKHGLEAKPEGGKITIRAWRDAQFLFLQVIDTGLWLDSPEDAVEGVGLRSTRERLEEFYGDAASLRISSDEGTTVAIIIPFHSTE